MPKTYTVAVVIGSHRAEWLADTIPNPLAQRGAKLRLDMQPGNGVHVPHAGAASPIDLTVNNFIYTSGLFQCMALCAVWNKAGNVFQNGYLAHVSNMGPPPNAPPPANPPFIQTATQAIPLGAWIVADIGVGLQAWGPALAQRLTNLGHADNHIWIYYRAANGQVGFGIDRHGRFGET
jgi:hypothetical protein